ncbi:MAG: hypothetical protein MJB57_11825 [Gemmatimonadetes bacterium]|nr:hypothetical protein [Gemmatimonadota bacterium]
MTVDMFLDQSRNVRQSSAVTANLLVRRAWFERVGGFDESLPSGGDYDFTRRALSYGALLSHASGAIVRHPTIDRGCRFLRKVWFTNRWSAARRARRGVRPDLVGLLTFVPFFGVALARRQAHRPVLQLCRPRLVAVGLDPDWRDDLRAMPVLYLIVAYVAGVARASGWLSAKLGRVAPHTVSGPAAPTTGTTGKAPAGAGRSGPHRGGREPAASRLPNLVVVGAQKCGTSALHYYLDLHPAIAMSRPKELNYFIEDRNWSRGPEWYVKRFDGRAPVRGETSPNYTAHPTFDGVPERMAASIPDARLIYIVRDPIERIRAHWIHNYARRREWETCVRR